MMSSLFNMLTGSSTTTLDLSHEYPAIVTHYTMEAQRFGVPNSQSSSPAAVQTQPHVASAQGPAPMDWEMSHEKCGYVWTGSLYLNGICAYARAQETEAVRDPYAHSFVKRLSILHPRRILSAWPKHFQLEPVFDSQINILDIQAWAHKTKASVVRLSGIDNMDKHHFGQLVEMLRSGRGVSRPSC
jgi:hypothetical protein